MKFIAGNIEFTNNMKQLLPDLSIYDKIIDDEPIILENMIWKKQDGLDSSGINSGSLDNINDNILYRSCYLIYKDDNTMRSDNINITVTNIHSNEVIPSDEFENWGLVEVGDRLFLLFIWIDIEQKYNINLSGDSFRSEDWYIQVVI